jgi:hypothetical protein
MWRYLAVVACLASVSGCQSPGCYNPFATGTRVPPPPTGSYGTPNTYYQPGSPAPPAGALPQGFRSSSAPTGQWTSARDDKENALSPATSLTAQASSTQSNAPSAAGQSISSTLTPAASATARTASPRLNGMPVNEIRASSEPRLFTPDGPLTRLMPSDAPVGTGLRPVQPAVARQSTGTASQPVTSASWQSRDENVRGRTN